MSPLSPKALVGLTLAFAGLTVAGAPGVAPAAAQVPTLDRVDSLMTAGAYDDARSTIERWWSAREAFDVPGSDRVRAHMLRAGLQEKPVDAEADYLSVVLGYPTSEHAPRALLRLGQGLLASGQHARAAGYLQRLVAEYSGRPERTTGTLWLARAHNAARSPAAACRAARQGIQDAGDRPDLIALLRIEETAACDAVTAGSDADDAVAAVAATAGRQPAEPEDGSPDSADPDAAERPAAQRDAAEPDAAEPEPAGGRFAVQAGAFRQQAGADDLMRLLRDRGYEPRAVHVPANSLLRIRLGRFTTAGEAARMVATLKDAGFDAFVVGDVHEERSP